MSEINASMVVLEDGTPCIVYDKWLPYPVKYVQFSRADFCITLIYDIPQGSQKFTQGQKFEHPLDPRFVKLLEERKNVGLAVMKNGELFDIKLFSVKFTNS